MNWQRLRPSKNATVWVAILGLSVLFGPPLVLGGLLGLSEGKGNPITYLIAFGVGTAFCVLLGGILSDLRYSDREAEMGED